MIEKVGNGIYIDSSKIEDNYFVFSLELPNIIYSHMTALYFHGLSIKAPDDKFDITVPNCAVIIAPAELPIRITLSILM